MVHTDLAQIKNYIIYKININTSYVYYKTIHIIDIWIITAVSKRPLKATVATQSVTSKSISDIIGVSFKERGYHPTSPQCITEIKNSRQFPKEISIRADTVAKHKTPKVAHTHTLEIFTRHSNTSFIRPPRTVRHQSSIWQENRYTSWPYKHSGGGRRGVLRGS